MYDESAKLEAVFALLGRDRLGVLILRAPYAMSSLLSIIVVTYEFIVLTLVHRYSYRLRDTTILFILGFCQIVPSFFLDEPAFWWTANISFCFAGALAFANELARNKKEAFVVDGIHSMAISKLKFDVGVSLLATGWSCAVAVWLSKWFGIALLVPMVPVKLGILVWERNYITRTHEKLGLEW